MTPFLSNFLFFTADNEAPIVTGPSAVSSMVVDTGMANASITWSSTPSAVDIVDGVISASNIICEDGASNVVMSNDSYGVGTTTVTCRVNDTALNTGLCQFNITVVGRYCLSVIHVYLFVISFLVCFEALNGGITVLERFVVAPYNNILGVVIIVGPMRRTGGEIYNSIILSVVDPLNVVDLIIPIEGTLI